MSSWRIDSACFVTTNTFLCLSKNSLLLASSSVLRPLPLISITGHPVFAIFITGIFCLPSDGRRVKDSEDAWWVLDEEKARNAQLWIDFIKAGERTYWHVMDFYVQREIIRRMAEELGKPMNEIIGSDFHLRFDFFPTLSLKRV